MSPEILTKIRKSMKLSQKELGRALGYAQKIRISELECGRVPVPRHIANAVVEMGLAYYAMLHGEFDVVRDWNRKRTG